MIFFSQITNFSLKDMQIRLGNFGRAEEKRRAGSQGFDRLNISHGLISPCSHRHRFEFFASVVSEVPMKKSLFLSFLLFLGYILTRKRSCIA